MDYDKEGAKAILSLKYALIREDLQKVFYDACHLGDVELLELLLASELVDIHGADDYALRFSSELGHIEIVKLLLEVGADVHAQRDYALRKSCEYGHIEVVKVLLEAGADVYVDDDNLLRVVKSVGL